ncbi:dihydrofolate reductase [bacterium]|nr:dihydrofolate reductase [bacterium]
MNPTVSIISSLTENGVIGNKGNLVFKVASDLNRFKELTMGHPIIMGRNTYLSIGRALPGRDNIVITSNKGFKAEGIVVANSLDSAISLAKSIDKEEVFIIGGGKVFEDAIKQADKLYLTLFHKVAEGDTFFPDYSDFKTVVKKEEKQEGDLKYENIDLIR